MLYPQWARRIDGWLGAHPEVSRALMRFLILSFLVIVPWMVMLTLHHLAMQGVFDRV